jgi:hypothetical protein
MTLPIRLSFLAALGLGLAVAGCQEQLTAPGGCPATCPGGTPVLRDTVLDALVGADSTHIGYRVRGSTAGGLRVSNGLIGATDYAVMRFQPRENTLPVRDTALDSLVERTYTIDSVSIDFSLLARDTTASGVVVEVHRLPAATDTGASFASIAALMTPSTLIDSVTIADSIPGDSAIRYHFIFHGDTTPLMQIDSADLGAFAIGFAISGAATTGIRIGGISSQSEVPTFRTWVTLNIADTTSSVKHQIIPKAPVFTTYVSNSVAPAPDSTILAIGTPDAARGLIRFPWPKYLRDSALLARATLELVPAQAIDGLPGDSASVEVRGVFADFGAKSPFTLLRGTHVLALGSLDTVRIDVVSEIQLWQGSNRLPHPPLLEVRMNPEGASFTEPRFYSTWDTVAARRPRLRITYQVPFDFERP